MNKIDVNDSNVKMYKQYLDIQNNVYSGKGSVLWFLLAMGVVALPPLGAIPYAFLFNQILLGLSITTSTLTPLIGIGLYFAQLAAVTIVWGEKIIDTLLGKIPRRLRMKKFLKRYPEFDTNVSEKEIEEEVKKYSKGEKRIANEKAKPVINKIANKIYDNSRYQAMNCINYDEEVNNEKNVKMKAIRYPKR